MKHIFISVSVVLVLVFGLFFFLAPCSACYCDETFCASSFGSVSISEFSDLLNGDVVLLDIRTSEEFESGHIGGAVNVDFYSSFENNLADFDKDLSYLIYCRTDSRTRNALLVMERLGFRDVYYLEGGVVSWVSNGFSLE